jgi:two-component system, LytTR family, sensor histidine kinase AlgZ
MGRIALDWQAKFGRKRLASAAGWHILCSACLERSGSGLKSPYRQAFGAVKSINQNVHRDALPDFRNLGVILRIVLIVLALSALVAVSQAGAWDSVVLHFLQVSAPVQPVLVLSLLTLSGTSRWLRRLDYRTGLLTVLFIELIIGTLVYRVGGHFLSADPYGDLERYWLFTVAATGLILYYFHLRNRALSPALMEARLQALQARIRPHFLFNSINAVLSLIRQDPKRAETALEDMADLFRVVMADNRDLSTLVREVELTRQYLDLEQLRLGERLSVQWHTENMPGEALIPPLVLQPLVENAVYHGIEPCSERGEISINVYKVRDEVHLVLRNPYRQDGNHHSGNKMALGNIRERLSLHFDAEASLRTSVKNDAYQVHIVLPYRREPR